MDAAMSISIKLADQIDHLSHMVWDSQGRSLRSSPAENTLDVFFEIRDLRIKNLDKMGDG